MYNIGGRAECGNIALVRELCQIADDAFAADATLRNKFPKAPAAKGTPSGSLVTFVADRPGHDRRYAIDCTKIERELGFVPRMPISEGLKQTMYWYILNETWWRAILNRSGKSG